MAPASGGAQQVLNRGIEAEVLPVAERYRIGTPVWSPMAEGMPTGRIRDRDTDRRRAQILSSFGDEARLEAVERPVSLAEEARLPMTPRAMAFAIAHRGVTSARIGPRTMGQLDDLLASVDVRLDDDLLDRIDRIVAPAPTSAPRTSRPSVPWSTPTSPAAAGRCRPARARAPAAARTALR